MSFLSLCRTGNLNTIKTFTELDNYNRVCGCLEACKSNHLDVVMYLTEHHNLRIYDWSNLLEQAAKNDNFQMTQYLCSFIPNLVDGGKVSFYSKKG